MTNIIVENAYKSSYLVSTIISLFYNNTYISDLLLNRYASDIKFTYLQELIKHVIISKFRDNKSIFSEDINKIRILCCFLGWKMNKGIFEEIEVKEFVRFLVSNLNENISKVINNKEVVFYEICCKDNSSVKTELEHSYTYLSNVVKIIRFFPLLIVFINRQPDTHHKMEIEKYIKIKYHLIDTHDKNSMTVNNTNKNGGDNLDISDSIDIKWSFHSAICFDSEKNFYYSLISNNKKWLLFSDNFFPSFIPIDMSNTNIIDKIKLDVVVVFYKTSNI